MYIPHPAKLLFTADDGRNNHLEKYGNSVSQWTRPCVERMLACGICVYTYGRQLNQHPHIHVSVTRGGLDVKHGVWRSLFFKKKAVEIIWRSAVIRLLRGSYERIMPGMLPGLGHIRDERQWRRYLQAQYGRYWKVHFAKKTGEPGTA